MSLFEDDYTDNKIEKVDSEEETFDMTFSNLIEEKNNEDLEELLCKLNKSILVYSKDRALPILEKVNMDSWADFIYDFIQ